MSDDEVDRIFSAERNIVPSANFARNVMDKVRMEASAPPPIPFPWKRALPGLILCVLSLVVMIVKAFPNSAPQHLHEESGLSMWTGLWSGLSSGLAGLLRAVNVGGLGWIILALLVTYASVKLSLRFVGRRI